MTRGEMKRRLRRDLRLSPGVYLYQDEWTQDELMREAADDVAFATDCLYGARTTGLVAGQARYSLPEFYRLKTLYAKDSGGQWRYLETRDAAEMDGRTGVRWRSDDVREDPPNTAVFLGPGQVQLYGTPLVSRAGALAFEGFYKPGSFWTFDEDGNGIPIADNQECPLPAWAHEAVYRVARVKAAVADERPETARLLPLWISERDGEMGNVEASAERHHATVIRYASWPQTGFWTA